MATVNLTATATDVDAPQWALDWEHRHLWSMYRISIGITNAQLRFQQRASWNFLRSLNAVANPNQTTLFALELPQALIPVPIVPPPPAVGEPLNHPPEDEPTEPDALGAHALFPATMEALTTLSDPNLTTLLMAYNVPGVVPGMTVQDKRVIFSNFIGVRM